MVVRPSALLFHIDVAGTPLGVQRRRQVRLLDHDVVGVKGGGGEARDAGFRQARPAAARTPTTEKSMVPATRRQRQPRSHLTPSGTAPSAQTTDSSSGVRVIEEKAPALRSHCSLVGEERQWTDGRPGRNGPRLSPFSFGQSLALGKCYLTTDRGSGNQKRLAVRPQGATPSCRGPDIPRTTVRRITEVGRATGAGRPGRRA